MSDAGTTALERYLADLPLLHSWDEGRTWNTGGFDAEFLGSTIDLIRSRFRSPRIAETGAGNSTITFLFSEPLEVLTICPDAELFARIYGYCDRAAIDTAPLRPVCDASEWALPRIAAEAFASGALLDFALIDGAHGWPQVMVDFCYFNAMLRRGGLLMIDDIQLHSVRELEGLLKEQPGFQEFSRMGKSVIFEKTSDERTLPDWGAQPYIVRNSTT